jgi:hypothetical protein
MQLVRAVPRELDELPGVESIDAAIAAPRARQI